MSYGLASAPQNTPLAGTTTPVAAKIVRTANGHIYQFTINVSDADLYWSKSTDHGLTWSLPAVIKAGSIRFVDVWYDRWTNANTGDLIHIAYLDAGNSDVEYNALDTSSDTLTGVKTIFAGTSSNTNCWHTIARMWGGNLICVFDIDGGTEHGSAKSTAVGASASFSAITDATEAASADYFLMAPGWNGSDHQDGILIFWDRSANEISKKVYDDSANTWTETSIATSMNDVAQNICVTQFAIAPDNTNSKVILTAWNDYDLSTADMKCWVIDESANTAKTDVVSNADDCNSTAITVDGTSWYVFYIGKSDGSQTAGTSQGLFYKVSTDGGTTWGSEQTISAAYGNLTQTFASLSTSAGDLPCLTGRGATDTFINNVTQVVTQAGLLIFSGMTAGNHRS